VDGYISLIEQGLTSPPTQYRLFGRQGLHTKKHVKTRTAQNGDAVMQLRSWY